MTDKTKLNNAIKNSGLKKNFISRRLGISNQQFYNKLNGKYGFTGEQIRILMELLRLDYTQSVEIFFAPMVAQYATTQTKNLEERNA